MRNKLLVDAFIDNMAVFSRFWPPVITGLYSNATLKQLSNVTVLKDIKNNNHLSTLKIR